MPDPIFHAKRPPEPPMGSIHAIHSGAKLLSWWVILTISSGFGSCHDLAAPLYDSPQFAVALSALLAIGGWRMFGPSARERYPWVRRLLAATWFVHLVPSTTAGLPLPLQLGLSIFGGLAVLGTAFHVASHTRRDTALGKRARFDTGVTALVVTLMWAFLASVPFNMTQTVQLPNWMVPIIIGLVISLLWGAYRLYKLHEIMNPGALPASWHRAAAGISDTSVIEDDSEWTMTFPVGGRTATLRVCRDPVPPWTEITLPVPELQGLVARRRGEDEAGGLPLGDLITDGRLYIEGDPERTRVFADPEGPWLELLHGWRGDVCDGVFIAIFEGDTPRSEWLGGPTSDGTFDEAVFERIIDGCRRAVASLESTAPEQTAVLPRMHTRATHGTHREHG